MTVVDQQSSGIHRPFPAGAVTIPIIWSSRTLKTPRSWRPIERTRQYPFYRAPPHQQPARSPDRDNVR